jgi:hypothetical protein
VVDPTGALGLLGMHLVRMPKMSGIHATWSCGCASLIMHSKTLPVDTFGPEAKTENHYWLMIHEHIIMRMRFKIK